MDKMCIMNLLQVSCIHEVFLNVRGWIVNEV